MVPSRANFHHKMPLFSGALRRMHYREFPLDCLLPKPHFLACCVMSSEALLACSQLKKGRGQMVNTSDSPGGLTIFAPPIFLVNKNQGKSRGKYINKNHGGKAYSGYIRIYYMKHFSTEFQSSLVLNQAKWKQFSASMSLSRMDGKM